MASATMKKASLRAWNALRGVQQAEGVAPIERLHELITLARELEAMTTDAVQTALDAGETWASIGDAAGITRAGAHRRWAADLRSRRLFDEAQEKRKRTRAKARA